MASLTVAFSYTLSDGTQRVMNICGVPGKTMVNFVEPSDYMFGTQGFEDRCEQGGIYNRGYCGLRIETLPDGVTDTLDAFYQALAKRETQARTVSFRLVGARTGNILRRFLPFIDRCQEEGNCAFWTSRGLEFVGLMQRPRIFPKGIWFDLFETQSALNPSNVHVVYYKEVAHAVKAYAGFPACVSCRHATAATALSAASPLRCNGFATPGTFPWRRMRT